MTPQMIRLFRFVLKLALPADLREPVLSDLDEEYRRFVRPARGRLGSMLGYLRQVRGSILPALVTRVRRRGRMRREVVRRQPVDWTSDLFLDLRQTLRFLKSRPGFALAASSAIALGIGANASIFSIVDGVLIRPCLIPIPSVSCGSGRRARAASRATAYRPPTSSIAATRREASAASLRSRSQTHSR